MCDDSTWDKTSSWWRRKIAMKVDSTLIVEVISGRFFFPSLDKAMLNMFQFVRISMCLYVNWRDFGFKPLQAYMCRNSRNKHYNYWYLIIFYCIRKSVGLVAPGWLRWGKKKRLFEKILRIWYLSHDDDSLYWINCCYWYLEMHFKTTIISPQCVRVWLLQCLHYWVAMLMIWIYTKLNLYCLIINENSLAFMFKLWNTNVQHSWIVLYFPQPPLMLFVHSFFLHCFMFYFLILLAQVEMS